MGTLLALIFSRRTGFLSSLSAIFDLCMKSPTESLAAAAACRGESSKHRDGQQVSPPSAALQTNAPSLEAATFYFTHSHDMKQPGICTHAVKFKQQSVGLTQGATQRHTTTVATKCSPLLQMLTFAASNSFKFYFLTDSVIVLFTQT